MAKTTTNTEKPKEVPQGNLLAGLGKGFLGSLPIKMVSMVFENVLPAVWAKEVEPNTKGFIKGGIMAATIGATTALAGFLVTYFWAYDSVRNSSEAQGFARWWDKRTGGDFARTMYEEDFRRVVAIVDDSRQQVKTLKKGGGDEKVTAQAVLEQHRAELSGLIEAHKEDRAFLEFIQKRVSVVKGDHLTDVSKQAQEALVTLLQSPQGAKV